MSLEGVLVAEDTTEAHKFSTDLCGEIRTGVAAVVS